MFFVLGANIKCLGCTEKKGRKDMGIELQRANMWKRISAWLLDIILLGILAVGAGLLLSVVLGYNSHNDALDAGYAKYEAAYGITFEITMEDYNSMTDAERSNYDTAYQAMIADPEVVRNYNMVLNLTLVITTLGILLAYLLLEFAVPLLFGNGQTLGKKVFGIGLIRNDGVQMNTMQLFVRTVLGKFTIETMIPVYVIIMLFFNIVGLPGTLLLAALLLTQLIMLAVTRNRTPIHDMLSGTVAVDISSQRIFRTTEELISYTKRVHAEKAARQPY